MTRIVHPGSRSWFLPIPDPGSRGQRGTGSRIRIRNTELFFLSRNRVQAFWWIRIQIHNFDLFIFRPTWRTSKLKKKSPILQKTKHDISSPFVVGNFCLPVSGFTDPIQIQIRKNCSPLLHSSACLFCSLIRICSVRIANLSVRRVPWKTYPHLVSSIMPWGGGGGGGGQILISTSEKNPKNWLLLSHLLVWNSLEKAVC